jgi:hypothetical protein
MPEQYKICTVHAQCGVGEFLWIRDSSDKCLIGSNMFSLMERASDQELMSEDLFNAFRDWAKSYMDGQPDRWGEPWQLDWPRFNAHGLALTRKLRQEVRVEWGLQYVTSDMDPSGQRLLLSIPPLIR